MLHHPVDLYKDCLNVAACVAWQTHRDYFVCRHLRHRHHKKGFIPVTVEFIGPWPSDITCVLAIGST